MEVVGSDEWAHWMICCDQKHLCVIKLQGEGEIISNRLVMRRKCCSSDLSTWSLSSPRPSHQQHPYHVYL